MIRKLSRAVLSIVVVAVLISSAHAVSYVATLLHPDDFLDTSGVGISNSSQVGSGMTAEFDASHALLWSGTAASYIDLNPAGFTGSYAIAATNTQQAGYGFGPTTGGNIHALLWSGTAGSVVDLNPTGFDVSYALGASGSNQVGYGFNTTDFISHALLWSGTAASKVDLHPTTGFTESFANGVSGNQQVGYGYGSATGDTNHALLWTGTAASKVDLNPSGFSDSVANDVYVGASTMQVGSGAGEATNGETHALVWSNTAASVVDLHPTSGFANSEALGASAAGQVGDGLESTTSQYYYALYWNGSAASVINLHATLFADTGYNFVSSTAFAIADNGNIVGTATDDGNITYAILWVRQPDGPVESGVAGDYNNNGIVDAADYSAWRKGNTTLHNEVATLGSNTPADYTAWRARFDNNTPGSGSSLDGASVPEPSTAALLLTLILLSLKPAARARAAR